MRLSRRARSWSLPWSRTVRVPAPWRWGQRLRTERAAEGGPAEVQLWPEHFDLATTIAEVHYGGPPGDDGHPEPYLYVGPWQPPEPDGAFWNEPFGASRADDGSFTVDDVLAFFHEGHQQLER